MAKKTDPENNPLSLSFSGSGFLALYQIGAVKALLDLAPEILKAAPKVYGASAGSLVAAAVVFNVNLGMECLCIITYCEHKIKCYIVRCLLNYIYIYKKIFYAFTDLTKIMQ